MVAIAIKKSVDSHARSKAIVGDDPAPVPPWSSNHLKTSGSRRHCLLGRFVHDEHPIETNPLTAVNPAAHRRSAHPYIAIHACRCSMTWHCIHEMVIPYVATYTS